MTGADHGHCANPKQLVILMTAYGTAQTAIEAMKFGAFDYVVKPFDPAKLIALVENALRTQAERRGDHWVLNGTKAWVTGGTHAGVILTMARTDAPGDRRGPRGITAFIVTPDMPGFAVGKKEEKLESLESPV